MQPNSLMCIPSRGRRFEVTTPPIILDNTMWNLLVFLALATSACGQFILPNKRACDRSKCCTLISQNLLGKLWKNSQEKFIWSAMASGTIFLGWKWEKTGSLSGKKPEIIAEDFAWTPFPLNLIASGTPWLTLSSNTLCATSGLVVVNATSMVVIDPI